MSACVKSIRSGARVAVMLSVICGFCIAPLNATAADGDELTDLLQQVGSLYAESYMLPFAASFGANQNSALYSTASIPGSKLGFSIGLKMMATSLNEDDKTFARSTQVTLDESLGVQPGDLYYGETATVYMTGPTVFGDSDNAGSIRAIHNGTGFEVLNQETIEGLFETSWVPLFTPEFSVGGFFGLRATVRWLPDMDMGDMGTFKYMGYGLQYSANSLLPTLPLDLMAGFFFQDLEVGNSVSTSAKSFFIAGSKAFAIATVYGGVAFENSEMDVAYTYDDGDGYTDEISFTYEPDQTKRLTMGATLNLGAKLNFEIAKGELVTYSMGMMFGF